MVYDYIIVGGGIVGVCTAWQLQQRYADKHILLLEKESRFSAHQTGHNSGVIHAGVYYQPGSLKAKFCREGLEATIKFCRDHRIPYEQCGKLLVATNPKEHVWMQQLFERTKQNQIKSVWLDKRQLHRHEPHINGLGAILVPATGITDYRQITLKMAELFKAHGGETKLKTAVQALEEKDDRVVVRTSNGDFSARYLIACAGLMSDRVAKMLGIKTTFQIIPFRGEYFKLQLKKDRIIDHLIYPIPDPDLPFLGVHLTRMIDGSVTVGPNAVLGLKREGYKKTDLSPRDMIEMLIYRGFWKVIRQNYRSGLSEFKNSLFKKGYLGQVRKYSPWVQLGDLKPYPAGVRAQAVDKNGTLIHDFLFENTARTFHVCNAPSPAATSSIPIGNFIANKVKEHFG